MDATQDVLAFKGDHLSVKALGCVDDCRLFTDAAMASGSHRLRAASGPFKATDIGKTVCVDATGQVGTVTAYIDSTQVDVSFAASALISPTLADPVYGSQAAIGTDNWEALESAVTRCAVIGRAMHFLSGTYLTTRELVIPSLFSIAGNDKDNSAAAILVFCGVTTGLHLAATSTNPGFAVTIDKLAVITMGGATDAVKLETPSQCVWRELAINDFFGHATNGLTIFNNIICFLYDPIITKCTGAAIRMDDTGIGTSHLIIEGGNLYQNQTVFDGRGIISHLIVRNVWIEGFNTVLKLSVAAGQQTSAENIIFDTTSFLAGTDGYVTYTVPKILRVTGLAGHNFFCKGMRFKNCRLFAVDHGPGTSVVENPFDLDFSLEAGISAFTLDLSGFLYSGVKTGLVSAKAAVNGSKPIVYTSRIEVLFSTAVPIFDPAHNQATWHDAFWGGDGLQWVDFSSPGDVKGSLQIKTDPDETGADPGQLVVGNKDFTRALRLKVPTTASGLYTAIMYLYGGLSSLAIKGLLSVGNDEQPLKTLYLRDVNGHTSMHVRPGTDDSNSSVLAHFGDTFADDGVQVTKDSLLVKAAPGTRGAQVSVANHDYSRALNIIAPAAGNVITLAPVGAAGGISIAGFLQLVGQLNARFLCTDGNGIITRKDSVDLASADVSGQLPVGQIAGLEAYLNTLGYAKMTDIESGFVRSRTFSDAINAKSDHGHTHDTPTHSHGGVADGTHSTDAGGGGTTGADHA